MTRIKFCGFTKPEDLEVALSLGIDAAGFVFEPASPRFVSGSRVVEMADLCQPFVKSVAVYGHYLGGANDVTDLVQAVSFTSWPQIPTILTVRPGEPSPHVPPAGPGRVVCLLVDSYHPDSFGGTGEVSDWNLAARYSTDTRIILAGGLTPDNVVDAIRAVKPYAVDVSSGIESSPGVKDHGKMKAFVEAVRSLG